ncbi:MAG: FAD-binding protein, partial [Cellvibrionales bacterium]|nr:FAD-binding protein [Cellvibrionales bacterium]
MMKRNVNLQAHNTLRLSSAANAYSKIDNLEALQQAINLSHAEQLPMIPLGEGSNVILQNTIKGHVLDIRLRGIQKIKET